MAGTKRNFGSTSDSSSREVFGNNKRCRIDSCRSETCHIHTAITEKLLRTVAVNAQSMCCKYSTNFLKINLLNVENSNAIDGSHFSTAFCRLAESIEEYSFSSLYERGFRILQEFLKNDEMPTNNQENYVLDMLLHFLVKMENIDAHAPFRGLEGLEETDIAIILANHLFGKLCTSSHFLIDRQRREMEGKATDSCPCLDAGCEMSGRFGDTGIGNPSVWHGNVDVIVNQSVIIEALKDELDCDSHGWAPVEVNLSRNQQIIAETIVFSFLQKQRHPEYSQFLFPCIGVKGNEMVVYFYDSEHDVLLESSPITILSRAGKLSVEAIIVSWLVVNHKYLCKGLTETLKTKNSGFFHQANEALNVYEKELNFGNIGDQSPKPMPHYRFVADPSADRLEERWASVLSAINVRFGKKT